MRRGISGGGKGASAVARGGAPAVDAADLRTADGAAARVAAAAAAAAGPIDAPDLDPDLDLDLDPTLVLAVVAAPMRAAAAARTAPREDGARGVGGGGRVRRVRVRCAVACKVRCPN